jgi:prevent-host-death family protein
MDDAFSVADAKAQFADLIHRAQAGQTVRITRRGKPVAVVLSQAEFQRLKGPRGSWPAFYRSWRQQMQDEGMAFMSDAELAGLRSLQARKPLKLG